MGARRLGIGLFTLSVAACAEPRVPEAPVPESSQIIVPPFSPPVPEAPKARPAPAADIEPPGVLGRVHLRLRSEERGFELHRLDDGAVAISQGMELGRISAEGEIAWDRAASRGLPARWSVEIDPVVAEVEGTSRGFTRLALGHGASAPSWLGYPLDHEYRWTGAGWQQTAHLAAGKRRARSGYAGDDYFMRASTIDWGGRTLGLMIPVAALFSHGRYSDDELSDRGYCFAKPAYWVVDRGAAGALPRLPADLCVREAHALGDTLVLVGMKRDGSVWIDIAPREGASRRLAVPGMEGCRRVGSDAPLALRIDVFSPSDIIASGTIECAGARDSETTHREIASRFDGRDWRPEPHPEGWEVSLALRHAAAAGQRWIALDHRLYERDRVSDLWRRVALVDPESPGTSIFARTVIVDGQGAVWIVADADSNPFTTRQGHLVFSSVPGAAAKHEEDANLPLVPVRQGKEPCATGSGFLALSRTPLAAPPPEARLAARLRAAEVPADCHLVETRMGGERIIGIPESGCELDAAQKRALRGEGLCLGLPNVARELVLDGATLREVR